MISFRNEKTPAYLKIYVSLGVEGEEDEHIFSKEYLCIEYLDMDNIKAQVFPEIPKLNKRGRIKLINHLVCSINDYKRSVVS